MDENLEFIKKNLEENKKISVIQLGLIKEIRDDLIAVIDDIDASEEFTEEEITALEKIRDYIDHLDRAEISYKKLQSINVSELSTLWGEANIDNIIKAQKIIEKELGTLEEYVTFVHNVNYDSLFNVFARRSARLFLKNIIL